MAIPPLTTKFVRYHDTTSSMSPDNSFGYMLRLLYEFWGFCVNGSNDLVFPGGFPTGSTPTTFISGVINMPAGWGSGSNVLLLSGNDGTTTNGMPWFTGSNFNNSHVGKYITLWRSGSSSTDDSIYQITRTFFPSGSTSGSIIGVDVNQGATPFSGSLKPAFTSRSNINYRVIDYSPLGSMTFTTNNFIVMCMNGARYVNPGQANSQVRLRLATFKGDTVPRGIAFQFSPSGSFTAGRGFIDSGSVGNVPQTPNIPGNIGEWGPYSNTSSDWANGVAGTMTMNLWGDQSYFIMFAKGDFGGTGCGIHCEIPQRLYPASVDPNPIAATSLEDGMNTTLNVANNNYAFGWAMQQQDSGVRVHYACIKHQAGDAYNTHAYPGLQGVPACSNCLASMNNGFYNQMWFNPFTNKFNFSDAILGSNAIISQNYLARCRPRKVRFIAPIVPNMQKLGDNGEWIHVTSGVVLPWDNAILPTTIFHRGF